MPWSSMSEVPENIKNLNGVKLTLSQANSVAETADSIPEGDVNSPWAVAISQFKKSHKVEDGKWVKKSEDEEKQFVNDGSIVITKERPDGKYNITAVSTAALPDFENETFTMKAMDYDIYLAEKTGMYPEFRMFHKKSLGIGRVTKMTRVGIFAVDSGVSYDDPFSLAVCKELLANNSEGKWKVSRGFNALEVSGGCPKCGETLVVNQKHMLAGYRCPMCDTVNLMYKGILKDVRFRKTRTFDVTVTDVPAVPWTGVGATLVEGMEEFKMNRDEIRQKLLDGGLEESVIDSRLKQLSDEDIAAFADIPDAAILKEFEEKEVDNGPSDDETYLVLDPEVLDDFGKVVKQVFSDTFKEVVGDNIAEYVADAVEKSLAGVEVELADLDVELKELDDIVELKQSVAEIKKTVDVLATAEEDRLQDILKETSPAGRLRISRHKSAPEKDEPEEENPEVLKENGELGLDEGDGVVIGGDGRVAQSMTDFVRNGGE